MALTLSQSQPQSILINWNILIGTFHVGKLKMGKLKLWLYKYLLFWLFKVATFGIVGEFVDSYAIAAN